MLAARRPGLWPELSVLVQDHLRRLLDVRLSEDDRLGILAFEPITHRRRKHLRISLADFRAGTADGHFGGRAGPDLAPEVSDSVAHRLGNRYESSFGKPGADNAVREPVEGSTHSAH